MWSIINVIFFVTLGYPWVTVRVENIHTMGREQHFKHQMEDDRYLMSIFIKSWFRHIGLTTRKYYWISIQSKYDSDLRDFIIKLLWWNNYVYIVRNIRYCTAKPIGNIYDLLCWCILRLKWEDSHVRCYIFWIIARWFSTTNF